MASSSVGEDIQVILSKFDMDVVRFLDPNDWLDFGQMNTKLYAQKLMRIMEDKQLNTEETTMVVVLAVAIKSRKRILRAMETFKNRQWYTNVKRFYAQSVCQYTGEETVSTFSVVHIPSSLPYLTARIWLQMVPKADATLDNFTSNLWAAQIRLDSDLLARQKTWERQFWNDVVKKGGPGFEKGGFNESYWETKASDNYSLLKEDGSEYKPNLHSYSKQDVEDWLKTRIDPITTKGTAGRSSSSGGKAPGAKGRGAVGASASLGAIGSSMSKSDTDVLNQSAGAMGGADPLPEGPEGTTGSKSAATKPKA